MYYACRNLKFVGLRFYVFLNATSKKRKKSRFSGFSKKKRKIRILEQSKCDTHAFPVIYTPIYIIYTVSGKKRADGILYITLANSERFSKFFHKHTLREICYK